MKRGGLLCIEYNSHKVYHNNDVPVKVLILKSSRFNVSALRLL